MLRINVYSFIKLLNLFHFVIVENASEHCASNFKCRCYNYVADCSSLHLTSIPKFMVDVISVNLSFNNLQQFSGKDKIPAAVGYLDLSNNNISVFQSNSFEGLVRLEALNLQNNHLLLNKDTFHKNIFKDLSSLKVLNLKHNAGKNTMGQYYPDRAFAKLTMLEEFKIDGLENNPFGPGFGRLKYLRKLNISGVDAKCSIPILSRAYFIYMKHLETVDVSYCKMFKIEKGTFQNLKSLTYLDISHNEDLTFRVCENVTYDLQTTSIKIFKINKIHRTFGLGTKLYKKDIEYLINTTLEELHLDSNRLELLEEGAAWCVPQTVRYISAADNKFTMGRYMFELANLTGVKEFNGRNQYTSHDPLDLFQITNPESCDVQKRVPCGVYQAQTSDYGLGQTQESNYVIRHAFHAIRFQSNMIIPIAPNIKIIHSSRCKLQYEIPNINFARKNQIKYLDLSGNILYGWKGPIRNLKKLTYLDLSNNYCSHVSNKFFEDLESVQRLILKDNLLGNSLAEDKSGFIFGHLKHLKVLDLSINRISLLHRYVFRGLLKLEMLNLSQNSLREWLFDFSHLKQLKLIDLSKNLLRELPARVRDSLDLLSKHQNISVNLLDNDLDCSCNKLHFLKWLSITKVNVLNLQKYYCFFSNNTKVKIDNLDTIVQKLEFECSSVVGLIFGVLAAIIVSVVIVIGGVIYRYRWKIRYLYYTTRNRYQGYGLISDLEADDEYIYDAFVSYADEDRAFVKKDMCKYLEKQNGCKLCIHHRDFLPGIEIASNITNAIHNSRKTIILLSKSFLNSYWCKFEFNMARMESIYSRKGQNMVFLVFYGSISTTDIPLIMMEVIESRSYIEYPNDTQGNIVFWAKMKEAILKRGDSVTAV